MDEAPPKPAKNLGGRPPVGIDYLRRDFRRKRIFAKYINQYAEKTKKYLEAELLRESMTVLEALAIRTLLRAAERGDSALVNLILNTNPGTLKKPTAEKEAPSLELPT